MFRRLSLFPRPRIVTEPIYCQIRGFRCGALNGPLNVRFRHRRNNNQSSQVLLDKFIKHVRIDASLVVKAPFSLKVRGSFFDASNNVDRERNRQMMTQLRGHAGTPASMMVREPPPEAFVVHPKQKSKEAADLREELFTVENNILDRLIKNLSQDFVRQLASDANLMKQSNGGRSNISDDDSEITTELGSSDVGDEHRLDEKSPVHVLMYGRSNHRLDSYSVLNSNNQHQTYVYISESSDFDQSDSMLMHFDPSATVSLWQPKATSTGANNLLDDVMVSGFKIFCPYHLLDVHEHDIKAVFLVPVTLGKLYLQADREGHIEVDGTLLDDLLSVGLYTEVGNVKVRDLGAVDIKLASRMGDILCEGSLDGHIVGETFGDGDFLARSVEGPSLNVSTEDGDIHVWNDCRTDVSRFTSRRGSIHVRDLYNQGCMEITESGNITTNLVSGSLSAYVERGGIFAAIDSLTDDSLLKVEKGEISVTLPQKSNFRIHASAPRTNISPKLLNSGEIFLSDKTGHETFVTHALAKSETQPTLNLIVANGSINIIMAQTEEERGAAAESFDSV